MHADKTKFSSVGILKWNANLGHSENYATVSDYFDLQTI